jgi:hypothetical protein
MQTCRENLREKQQKKFFLMCNLGLYNEAFRQQWPNSAEKKLKLNFKDYSARI